MAASWKKVVLESASGEITQNAATASALETARTISLGGDLSGSASFDGSADITISATVADDSHAHVIGNIDGLQAALDAKQASDADLTAIAGLSNADGNFIVGNGTTWVAESGSTARSSLGLGSLATKNAIASTDITDGSINEADLNISNAPQSGYILSSDGSSGFTWIANTAAANNSTITLTAGAGLAAIGDGSFTLNQGGNETFTFAVDGVLEDLDTLGVASTDGQFIVATGAGTFAYESGSTVRTSLGLGTGDNVQFTDLTLTGNLTVNGTTTTVNSTTVEVADKMLKLANVATPSTTSADGGGIQIESSGTESNWPELKWNSSMQLSGWTLSDHTAGTSTDFPICIMEFGTAAPSSPSIETEGGTGSFFADATNGNLYLYI